MPVKPTTTTEGEKEGKKSKRVYRASRTLGSYSAVQCQAFDGPASLLLSCPWWCVEKERLWCWLHPLSKTQQHHLASMASWLSSTGISKHDPLPHISSIHLSTVNTSPGTGVAPQSLNSSSQPLPLPGGSCSCLACVWLQQGLSESHSI